MGRKKVWVVTPLLYIVCVLMAAMTAASWFWAPQYVFWPEAAVTAALIVLTAVLSIQFRNHISRAIIGAARIADNELAHLDEFSLPVMVLGSKEDILWVNRSFVELLGEEGYIGAHISSLLGEVTLGEIIHEGGDIAVADHEFSVYGRNTEAGAILYFVEDTYYKKIEREFHDSRPVIAMAAFDNREEIMRDSNSGEETRVLGQFESTLNDWAYSVGGIYKKLSGGTRYWIMMSEHTFQQEMRASFPILERIRKIKNAEGRSATVSLGFGQCLEGLSDGEHAAHLALDMALGRGGDQVAIKQEGDSYEFYGGLSNGMEKRNKSRTRVIAGAISDLIRISDLVLIMGHKFSDLDAIGSAVGMWSAAHRGMHKNAYVVVDRRQTLARPLIEAIEKNTKAEDAPVFISPEQAMELVTSKTLLIVTDTHSQDYVESPKLLEKVGRLVVIDHHRLVVKHIQNASVFFHETYASSASEMVAELVQFIGSNVLTKTEAEALLSGIMLDTKGFTVRCGVRTFEAAAYLRRRDADTVETKRLFADSIENYKAKFELVSRAEIYGSCAIACSTGKNVPNIRIVASQAADELLTLQDVYASFVLFENNGSVNISARSFGDVNVQLLMEALGGGGHLTMAAAQLTGMSMEQAKQTLLKVLQSDLQKATKFPELKA